MHGQPVHQYVRMLRKQILSVCVAVVSGVSLALYEVPVQ